MMIIRGSLPLTVCLLLSSCRCQSYEDDGPSHYSEDGGETDYTPYFNGAGAQGAPLVSGNVQSQGEGFVQPLDFSSFFVSPDFAFGAASAPVQQKQNGFIPTNFQVPGQVPVPAAFQHTIQHPIGAAQNFENFFVASPVSKETSKRPSPPKTPSNKDSLEVEDLNNYDSSESSEEKAPKLTYRPSKYNAFSTLGKTLPYVKSTPYQKYSFQPVGNLKSASFESIKATSAPYKGEATGFKSIKSTPYREASIRSTSAPYKAEATESKAQKQNPSKNCRKINRQLSKEDISHGRFRRGAEKMNCYVCEDPKSGGSYEQCSYSSDPETDDYFVGHASKYSTQGYPDYRHKRSPPGPPAASSGALAPNSNSDSYRTPFKLENTESYSYFEPGYFEPPRNKRSPKRRSSKRNQEQEEDFKNPYDEEKSASHAYNSQPDEFGSEYYKAPDFGNFKDDYRFGPEYFTESTGEDEKSYSETQAEELKKSPENCQKVKKDNLTCMVCKNPKTGGNYEQCSYSSEPEEKKYAYVKEKKYNSKDDDPEADEEEETQQKEVKATPKRHQKKKAPQKSYEELGSYEVFPPAPEKTERGRTPGRTPGRESRRERGGSQERQDGYEVFHPSATQNRARQSSQNRESSKDESSKEGSKEDYVSQLFPDYASRESQIQEEKQRPGYEYKSDLPEYFTAEESKKDVDSVLAEFAKKDRSNCKKISKNEMTCFICTDAKGVNHEECMFISESSPKKSHLAYHEVKEFSSDPQSSSSDQLKVITTQVPSTESKKRRITSKKTPSEIEVRTTQETRRAYQTVSEEPTVEGETTQVRKTQRIPRRNTNIKLPQEKSVQKREADYEKESEKRRQEFFEQEKKEEDERESEKDDKESETENLGKDEQKQVDDSFGDVEGKKDTSEGAFASELVPVFSKKFGTTLPKFMLDISEHEKNFDEVVASG